MPDISMCKNTQCNKRNDCYRFRALPNPCRQTYTGFSAENCKYFISIEAYDTRGLTKSNVEIPHDS